MDTDYRTPEGFSLYRPLLLPEVRDFREVLTIEEPWNYETMNHRNGKPGPDHKPDLTHPSYERVVSRFCHFSRFPERRRSAVVTPSDAVLALVWPEEETGQFNAFSFYDRVSWEAIYHPENERVLIVASASRIIASRYIAYVDPATVPEV